MIEVFHFVDYFVGHTDFSGTWKECMDWIRAQPEPLKYYLRMKEQVA